MIFGLMGIAFLGISTVDTFSKTGFDVTLVQKGEDINGYLDTAWVMQSIRGLVLSGILFAIAPLVVTLNLRRA